MHRNFKKRQTLIIAVASIIISYALLRCRTYNYEGSVVIPNIHPSHVWEFVADFSNMKYLNPTIIDFNILSESGNYQRWQYSTEYTENLSHWPHLLNTALAHYEVKEMPSQNVYYITSHHTTCMFSGLFCLKSSSEFKFSQRNNGALCLEEVIYECPFLLSRFCEREVKFQRNEIFTNLKIYFAKK